MWEDPDTVRGALVFQWQDALHVTEGLPAAKGADAGEGDRFSRVITGGVRVFADGVPCPGRLDAARPFQGDAFVFTASFRCARGAERLVVELPLLRGLPGSHRHLSRLTRGGTRVERTLTATDTRVELVSTSAPAARPEPSAAPGSSVLEGVRHILLGWDHLLFLFGLSLGAFGVRALLLPVTAFTVAHSLTLALAALDVVTPAARLVEPAIALSIGVVGFENLRGGDPRLRTGLTFVFGAIHGFGFSAGLRALAFDRARLVGTLFGFNLGVEIGQILALSLLVAVASGLDRLGPTARRRTSFAVGAAGAVLCIVRVVHPG